MSKRARDDGGEAGRQTKKPKRDDANNPKMTVKDRYEGNNGYFCPEWFKALEKAASLNNGQIPPSVSLTTSDYYHKNVWSRETLPEILFYIKAPEIDQVQPVNVNGQMLLPQIVPQQIAIDTEEWRIGAWLRLDPRISLRDIKARMHNDLDFLGGPLTAPNHSTLNNRMHRKVARIFGHLNGSRKKNQLQIIEDVLSPDMIARNTILEPIFINGEHRLVKKKLVVKYGTTSIALVNVNVTEANYLETTFPYHYFQLDSDANDDVSAATDDVASPALTDDAATPALTDDLSSAASDLFVDPATPSEHMGAAITTLAQEVDEVPAQKNWQPIRDPSTGLMTIEDAIATIVAEVGDLPPQENRGQIIDLAAAFPLPTFPALPELPALPALVDLPALPADAELAAFPTQEYWLDPSNPFGNWKPLELPPVLAAAEEVEVVAVPAEQLPLGPVGGHLSATYFEEQFARIAEFEAEQAAAAGVVGGLEEGEDVFGNPLVSLQEGEDVFGEPSMGLRKGEDLFGEPVGMASVPVPVPEPVAVEAEAEAGVQLEWSVEDPRDWKNWKW